MSTQADFTPDEWAILLQAPAFVALYIAQSDRYSRAVAFQKMLAGIRAIFEAAPSASPDTLIGAVRAAFYAGQQPHYPATLPVDLAAARRLSLQQCRQVAVLLTQRVPDSEAAAYASWLVAIGEAVAAVPIEPLLPGQDATRVADYAQLALEDLVITLSVC